MTHNMRLPVIVLATAMMSLTFLCAPALQAQETATKLSDTIVIWDTLSREQKVKLLTNLITKFRINKGITIRKEPAFYVDQIETIRLSNPALVTVPVGTIFRILAFTYGDFDNGQDPDTLIREELGEATYQNVLKNKEAYENIYRTWLAEHGF